MTSSNGNIFHVTGPLCGEFTGDLWNPSHRPVTRSFDAFLDLRLNKRLSKHPIHHWFEAPSRSLEHHCNANHDMVVVSSFGEYMKKIPIELIGILLDNMHLTTTDRMSAWNKALSFVLINLVSWIICCCIKPIFRYLYIVISFQLSGIASFLCLNSSKPNESYP